MKKLFIFLLILIFLCACNADDQLNGEETSTLVDENITQEAEVDLGVASFENAVLTPAAGWGSLNYDPPVPGTYN
ncbi:MAG: hypothetical protein AAF391_11985, partial [Bacteroidota bacterium]